MQIRAKSLIVFLIACAGCTSIKPPAEGDVTDAELNKAPKRVEQLEKEQAELIQQAQLANIDVPALLSRRVFVSADSAGEFQPYVDDCLSQLQENNNLGVPAEVRKKAASVTINVTFARSGSIVNVALPLSSGVPAFDSAVVEAISAAPACSRIPSSNTQLEELVVSVPASALWPTRRCSSLQSRSSRMRMRCSSG